MLWRQILVVVIGLFVALPANAQVANDMGKLDPAAQNQISKPAETATESPIGITPPAEPTSVTIIPHRAFYKMELGSVKNGSSISGVSGKMVFEWADSCDGWAVQQHMQLHFNYAQGDETDVSSTVITWEAKDGKRYNFNVRRMTNGKETENYRGKATLATGGGVGKYAIPKNKEVKLAADALFPSAHTVMILQKAMKGEKLFSRMVFDGSDEDGAADISSFIGQSQNETVASEVSPELKSNPLLQGQAWPVRMAFFKLKSETGEPDYEMNLTLMPNGVARSMQIDYGDFSVTGTLSELEALPASGCGN